MNIDEFEKRMNFKKLYPIFYDLMICWFHESDLDGLSDEEVIIEYSKVYTAEDIKVLLNEIEKVKLEVKLWFDVITFASNEPFEGINETLEWIEKIERFILTHNKV